MSTLKCEVIHDLLPLYIENICSDETRKLVEEHINNCDECRKLYENMTVPIQTASVETIPETKKFLNCVKNKIFTISIVIAVIIACYILNFGGAGLGGPALIGSFVITLVYIAVVSVFICITKSYKPFLRFAWVLSLLTFISATYSCICSLFNFGGFISGVIGIISSVPFYGLRMFLDWSLTYFIASLVSLVWLIITGINLKKLKK